MKLNIITKYKMKQLKLFHGNYFYIAVTVISLIIALIIILQTLISYHIFMKENINTFYYFAFNNVNQAKKDYENVYQDMRNLALALSFDAEINELLYDKEYAPVDLYTIDKKLGSYVQLHNLDSIYIYNESQGKIFNSLKWSEEEQSFPDQNVFEYINYPVSSNFALYARNASSRSDLLVSGKNVLTCIFYPGSNSKSSIIINVDGQRLNEICLKYPLGEQSNLIVADDSGLVISSGGREFQSLDNISHREFFVQKSSKDEGDYQILSENGNKFMTTYVYSSILNYWFISMVPYETMLSSNIWRSTAVLYIGLGVLIFGMLLVFAGSKKFSGVFNRLWEKIKNLERKDYYYTQWNKEKLLINLLTFQERIDEEDLKEMFEGVKTPLKSYEDICLIRIIIDNYRIFCEKYNPNDRDLFKYALRNLCGELIGHVFLNEILTDREDSILVLVGGVKGNYRELLEPIFPQCSSYTKQYLDFDISFIVSEKFSPTEMALAYTQVNQMSHFCFLYGAKSVIYPEMTDFPTQTDTQQQATELKNALIAGTFDKVRQIIDEIVEKLHKIHYETAKIELMRILFIFSEVSRAYRQNRKIDTEFNLSATYNDIENAPTIVDAQQILADIINHFENCMQNAGEKRQAGLTSKALEIIETEYHDANLCLDSIAERLGISSFYLSKIFRTQIMKPLPDYITDVRLAKASELLRKTDISIKNIITSTGFVNNSYFTVLFKKTFGTTPSVYRQTHKTNIAMNESSRSKGGAPNLE